MRQKHSIQTAVQVAKAVPGQHLPGQLGHKHLKSKAIEEPSLLPHLRKYFFWWHFIKQYTALLRLVAKYTMINLKDTIVSNLYEFW